MFSDFDEFILDLIVLVIITGIVIFISIKINSYEKQKQYIFDNSNEYTVFNNCEKIYDRYYCKNN